MVILNISNVPDNPCNGVSNIVPQIVNWQNKCGAESELVNLNGRLSGCEYQFECNDNLDIKQLPKPFCNPDIVVFHEVYKKQFPAIAKKLVKQNIPYVVIPHGCMTETAQKKKALKKIVGNFLIFNSFINSSVAFQCVSEEESKSTKCRAVKFVGGFGTSQAEDTKTDFSENGIRLIYIGRLEVNVKGLDLLVEAINKASDYMRKNRISLKIFGPDYKGQFAQVERLIEDNNVEDIVSLKHEIFGEEKKKELLDSDVFVQTSRSEGLPLSILEALSYGLPCLVTEGTCFAELINKYDAGIGVGTNADEIAEAIKQIDKSKLKKQSQNALRLIRENFSWEEKTKKNLSMYERLV